MTGTATAPSPQSLARLAGGLRALAGDAAHGAGCACCGRGLARIDARAIELDMLAFLSIRYQQAGDAEGAAIAERWLAVPGEGLIALLRNGDGEGPPPGRRVRMLDDLLAILAAARGTQA